MKARITGELRTFDEHSVRRQIHPPCQRGSADQQLQHPLLEHFLDEIAIRAEHAGMMHTHTVLDQLFELGVTGLHRVQHQLRIGLAPLDDASRE